MKLSRLLAILACARSLSVTALAGDNDPPPGGQPGGQRGAGGGPFADGHGACSAHPGWQGNIQHFNPSHRHDVHWWHGTYPPTGLMVVDRRPGPVLVSDCGLPVS